MTGNNRTKPGVIGLHGVVKKAVGLGGWHWLRLETGAECRLQRNALAIVARPTGLELDSESDDDDDDDAGFAHLRDGRLASAARPPRDDRADEGEDAKLCDADYARPRRVSRPSAHVRANAGVGSKRSRGDTASRGGNLRGRTHGPSVRFEKLRRETLEKISSKHYKVDDDEYAKNSDQPEKRRLVETIANRFTNETVDETKVLIAFIKALAGGELPAETEEEESAE